VKVIAKEVALEEELAQANNVFVKMDGPFMTVSRKLA